MLLGLLLQLLSEVDGSPVPLGRLNRLLSLQSKCARVRTSPNPGLSG